MSSSSTSGPSTQNAPAKKKPTVILNIGMAGSGKSTLMHQMCRQMVLRGKRIYSINLDPAVMKVEYPCAVDIRDNIKYKDVMKEFNLGPNGAIVTCLNLFATKFDQVLKFIEDKEDELDYVLIDTPGQIEVFSMSASGQIICDTLAVAYPTVVNYVIDIPKCARPVTFMSNMLYATSILYKTKVPFLVAFNKCDVIDGQFLQRWMTDCSVFITDLSNDETTYLANLSRSMALSLQPFYENLLNATVSAITGQGFESEWFPALEKAEQEYHTEYTSFLESQQLLMKEQRERAVKERMAQFERKMDKSRGVDDENDVMMDEDSETDEEKEMMKLKNLMQKTKIDNMAKTTSDSSSNVTMKESEEQKTAAGGDLDALD